MLSADDLILVSASCADLTQMIQLSVRDVMVRYAFLMLKNLAG